MFIKEVASSLYAWDLPRFLLIKSNGRHLSPHYFTIVILYSLMPCLMASRCSMCAPS